jgi:hypothetical protein
LYSFFDVLSLVKEINKSKSPLKSSEIPPPYIEEYKVEEYIVSLDSNWGKQLSDPNKKPSLLLALKETLRRKWNLVGLQTTIVCII